MEKNKYVIRAECPQCARGEFAFPGPEELRERFIGDEKEVDVLCPICGTKHRGRLQEGGSLQEG